MTNSTDYFSTHYKDYIKETQIYYANQIKRYSNNFDDIIFKYNNDANCLDLGCGIGDFVAYLKHRKFNNVTALDTSTESIDICKKNFPEYEFKTESIEDFFQHNTKKFDIISMFSVLEHLPLNKIVIILNLIKQNLKPGGVFIFSTPNMDTLFGNTNGRYNDFTHTIFTDESSFQLFRNTVRRWTKCPNNELKRIPTNRQKVHVWGAISKIGRIKLYFFPIWVNMDDDIKCLNDTLLPFARDTFETRKWTF